MDTTETMTTAHTRPDFWDVLVTETLTEEGFESVYDEVNLAEYDWWADEMSVLEEKYENGEVTPAETRREIARITTEQYAEILESAWG